MERYRDMKIVKKTNLKMIRNLVFFLLLIILTFWSIFKDQDIHVLFHTFKKVQLFYVFMGALLMLAYLLLESFNIRNIITSLKEKKLSLFKHLKYTLICFFFSAITPAATGGQPVEVYYMSKEGISVPNGTIAMLLQLSGYQISTVSLSIIMAFLYPKILSGGVLWFFLIGIVFNSMVIVVMLLSVFSRKTTEKFVHFFIRTLRFFKVRNINKKEEKILSELEKFNQNSEFIRNNKKVFLQSVFITFMQLICYFSITYCVYKAFGLTSSSFLKVFAMQAILYTTVCCLPLPGSIGVSETLFLKIYGSVFSKGILSSAMLIYRFISFYFYIIISAIVVIINAIKTKNIVSTIDQDITEIDD